MDRGDVWNRVRSSAQSRRTITSVLLVVALAPRILTYGGVRLLDDPILGTVVAVVVAEWQPLAGFGFVVLLTYLVVSEVLEPRAEGDRRIERRWSTLIVLTVALVYAGFLVVLWIDPRAVGTGLIGAITAASRTIYTSSLVSIVDPVFVRSVEFTLVESVRSFEGVLLWTPGRPTRWPLYLFVAYVAVAELVERADWFPENQDMVRYPVRLVGAVVVLIYGLVFAHNFFPGDDSLPWLPETMAVWLALHTGVAVVVLTLSKPSIPSTQYRTASFVGVSALVYLLLGVGIAVLDGLYPVPELILLGTALLLFVERHYSSPVLQRVEVRVTDLVSQFANGLAAAWAEPSKLVAACMAVQGFFLAGWTVWLLLFSVGGLFGPTDGSFAITAVVTLVFSPVLVASAYVMWYWASEIERLADGSRDAPISTDFLGFPTLIVASFFAVRGGLASILLALCGTLVGLYGMYASTRGSLSTRTFPRVVNRHAVILAFLVQFGGPIVVSRLVAGPTGANTSYLELLVLTLVPTYVYTHVRVEKPDRFTEMLPEFGIVTATLFLLWILPGGWSIAALGSAAVGVGAASLMVIMTGERTIGLLRR